MPLSELLVNDAGEGIALHSRARSESELHQPKGLDIDGDQSSLMQDPSSIQSMLKNATETGDLGQFSTRPLRLPQSLERTPLPLNQQSAAKRPFVRQHLVESGENVYQGLTLSHTNSNASSGAVSLQKTRSQRSYRTPSHTFINKDERLRSNTQNTYASGSLPSLNSQTTFKSQGLLDPRAARPRSPFAYPTRLKRPGYRPSSPALSDHNRFIHGSTAGNYRDDPSRTSSPIFAHGIRKALSTRHPAYAQPEPTFRRYPPSPMTSHTSTRASSPLSTLETTPGPLSNSGQAFFEARESLAPNSAHSGWNRQSLSPSPIFYDYTEAFEENHFRSSTMSLAEQVILENPNTLHLEFHGRRDITSLFATPANSESPHRSPYSAAKIPDIYNPTSEIYQRLLSDLSQHHTTKSGDPSIIQSLTSENNVLLPGHGESQGFKFPFTSEEPIFNGEIEKMEYAVDDARLHQAKPATTDPVVNSSDISFDSVPPSTSPKESMYSVRSSPNLERSSPNSPTRSLSKTDGSGMHQRATSSQSASIAEQHDASQIQSSFKTQRCDRWSESEPSQIYAPTPERSMSSPTQRDRFSRIFSIGEGPLEADNLDLASDMVPTDFATLGEIDETRDGDSSVVDLPSLKPKNSSNTLPRTARDTHQIVTRSKSDYGGGSMNASRDDLVNLGSTRTQSELFLKKSSEPISLASDPLPLARLSVVRKPALDLSVPPAPQSTGDQTDPSYLGRDFHNSLAIHLLERTTPTPQLPSMPSMISFRSCSPPAHMKSAVLPFAFTPLLANEENRIDADVQEKSNQQENDKLDQNEQLLPSKYKLKLRSDRNSLDSLPGSRPWNLDASYPWTNLPPELKVTMPEQSRDSLQSGNKPPRFKLKIHRASQSATAPTKLTKHAPIDLSTSPKTSISSEFFRSRFSSQRPRPSITITQNNSSHSGPVAARFSANQYSSTPISVTPSINLIPPSPGLNLEVRSFFSDDSSQMPPRGSLRKRFSQLKAMAGKTSSIEDVRGTDRGLHTSAMGRSRASGRSSRQEDSSELMYNLRNVRLRIIGKLKNWFSRGEKKARWRGKKSALDLRSDSTTLYPGT